MTGYFWGLLAFALCCAAVELLTPSGEGGGVAGHIKWMSALCLLCVLITPIAKAFPDGYRGAVCVTNYKTGVFEYDPETMLYKISQYGKAYTDGNTGEQVSVTNVLILETAISVISGDKEGRLTVKMTGEGAGTYFCGGKSVPITWSKADRNSPFVYTCNGAPLALETGVSYICIMDPADSVLSVE